MLISNSDQVVKSVCAAQLDTGAIYTKVVNRPPCTRGGYHRLKGRALAGFGNKLPASLISPITESLKTCSFHGFDIVLVTKYDV